MRKRCSDHDFNDGRFAGFEVPKTDQEARVRIVNGRIETHWDQRLYNGTNSGRKAQSGPMKTAITSLITSGPDFG